MIAGAPSKTIRRHSLADYYLLPETAWIALLGLADLLSTLYWLERGATESNPFLAYFLSYGMIAFFFAKLLTLLAPLAFSEWCRWHYDGPRIQRLLRCVLCLYVLGYVCLFGFVNR